CQHYYDGPYSF
nr:immunoglobulin light chain junction region [Macaca mulatta]MOW39698.1 immunoglobulin light chain junction region [Macaca mulatta]MOW40052.1 immunoglobulin light chain junction region [Macaca mulatta]